MKSVESVVRVFRPGDAAWKYSVTIGLLKSNFSNTVLYLVVLPPTKVPSPLKSQRSLKTLTNKTKNVYIVRYH